MKHYFILRSGVAISGIMKYNEQTPANGQEFIVSEDVFQLEEMMKVFQKPKEYANIEVIKELKCIVANAQWDKARTMLKQYFNLEPCCSSAIESFVASL